MTKIAILGGGQIGEALTSGLVESGFSASDITVTNRTASRGEELKSRYGVNVTTDNAAAVDGADYIFASVKPYAILDLLSEIKPAADAVVVSMAAGLTLEALQSAAGQGVPIVRVMPNTPMLVRRGMCTCAAGEYVTEVQMQGVTELLEAVGEVAVIPEKNIDAATALAGSSPAYFFLVAEALVDAGVQLGLPRDIAEKLAAQAAAGAGDMLANSGRSATQLRAGVTSPGGTTAAAVRELEESGLRGAFYRAAEACSEKAKKLG